MDDSVFATREAALGWSRHDLASSDNTSPSLNPVSCSPAKTTTKTAAAAFTTTLPTPTTSTTTSSSSSSTQDSLVKALPRVL